MTIEQTPIRLFHASLTRATYATDFYDLFYQNFMHGEYDVKIFFKNKDMEQIKKKLKMTLEMTADHADGAAGLDMYFDMLGKLHNRLNIHPALFQQWRDALLATAALCDAQFNKEIHQAWEHVIENVIAKMNAVSEEA